MAADKKLEARENSQMALTLTLEAAAIESAYDKKLAEYAKTITFDGFRKGKAPKSVVEKKVGSYAREEATFNLMEELVKSSIETLKDEEKPLPYSTPELQDEEKLLPFKKDTDVTFTVVYDVKPEVKLGTYKGLTIELEGAEVKDSDIQKEIDGLLEQNSTVVTKDGDLKDGDIVTVNFVELDENGAEKADTKREDFTFTVGAGYNYYGFDKEIEGMKAGDKKVIEKTYAADYAANPALAGKTVKVSVEVTAVKVRQLPELNDEFAQDVKEEYKTVEDLKNGIKADLQKSLDTYLENNQAQAIVDEIAKTSSVEPPKSMIDFALDSEWRNFLRQIGRKEEEMEAYFKHVGLSKEAYMADMLPGVLGVQREG